MNKHALRRRTLPKFGDASGAAAGPENNVTYVSFETVTLDLKQRYVCLFVCLQL